MLNKDVSVRDSTQDVLIRFYKRFCLARREHFNRSWSGVWQFILRIFNRESAVIKSLTDEIHHMPSQLADFDRLVFENKIDREEVVEFKDALKSQKEEFVGRSSFLIIYIASIALLINLITMFDGVLIDDIPSAIFYTGVMLFALVLLMERDGINKRVSASEQLCIVIDRWLENNPKEEVSVRGISRVEPEEITESFLEELVKETKETKEENVEKSSKVSEI